VVIPAYNEERFIGSVVLKAQKYAGTILVVDDGSTDATGEVARAAGALLLEHPHNLGKGVALNTAFRAARRLDVDAVVTLDADGQHLPQELTLVVAPILSGAADIVIGSRYLADASRVPHIRAWGHKMFNLVTGSLSGTTCSDSQSGFRAFSRAAINAITFCSDGFSVESEMQFLARQHSLKLMEVPVTVQYLDGPKRSLIRHGLTVINGILRLTGQYRPLLFFGAPGSSLALTGFAIAVWIVEQYRQVHSLAVGHALVSLMLFIIGMIGLSTGIILHSVRGLLLDLHRSGNHGA
jgi:glycosyltransferase involved in cell wall biosynthesis